MLPLLAEVNYSFTLTDIGTISAILAVVCAAIMALFGMKFMPRATYYEQRETDRAEASNELVELTKRVSSLETSIAVLSAGQLKEISDGMAAVRRELEQGRESREKLVSVLASLTARLEVIESDRRERMRHD